MYGFCLKDSRGEKKQDQDIRTDWQDAVARKEGCHDPGMEIRKDLSARRPTSYDLGDELKAGPISDDEFSHYSFPTIGFCDSNAKAESSTKQARISDLCKEDRQRIAQLVTEISRCRDEQKEKTLQAKKMHDENVELKISLGQLEKDLSSLRLGVKYGDENLKLLSKSHAAKESSLRNQNLELQSKVKFIENEKAEMHQKLDEVQKQTEKLANVVYYVTNENKKIYKKYENVKEKLKTALELISQLETREKEMSYKQSETKSSQTNLELTEQTKSKVRFSKKEYKCHKKCPSRKEEHERGSSDDSLISELFFIPKQKNHAKAKYFSDEES